MKRGKETNHKSVSRKDKSISKLSTKLIAGSNDRNKLLASSDKDRSSVKNLCIASERTENLKRSSQNEVRQTEDKTGKADSHPPSVDFNKCTSSKSEEKGRPSIDQRCSDNNAAQLSHKQKLLDDLIIREGSIEKILKIKKPSKTVYDVDRMSPDQIRESLCQVDARTTKAFSFLADIQSDNEEEDRVKPTRISKDHELSPTDIDLQLSSLVKRVELNRALLEKTNQRIKEINFLAERNKMISIRDMNYDEESFLKLKEAGDIEKPVPAAGTATVFHPAIEELKKTMNATVQMLGYVNKMSSGDLMASDLEVPPELTEYLRASAVMPEKHL
ncbi:uncharacterized protein LOC105685948 isoform X1 [Athalia rosae]|uniref:uncharacterized protein LOC105685948 isoform X1 n=1 Tax=Athalia rosae TaxID=37344 RepID=UPI002033BC30|nr:uncharacterized protein LOC105685948 isoform X1 [Athalia rosae]